MSEIKSESEALLNFEMRSRDEGHASTKTHLISFEKSERLKEVSEIQRSKTEDDSQDQENALSRSNEARDRLAHETLKADQVSKDKE